MTFSTRRDRVLSAAVADSERAIVEISTLRSASEAQQTTRSCRLRRTDQRFNGFEKSQ